MVRKIPNFTKAYQNVCNSQAFIGNNDGIFDGLKIQAAYSSFICLRFISNDE